MDSTGGDHLRIEGRMVKEPEQPAPLAKEAKARPDAPLQAILVIHGIGQQLPFQPLDGFTNGLRAAIQATRENKKEEEKIEVSLTHYKLQRGSDFDHFLRLKACEPAGKAVILRLDIYEFYWAPLTQGEASLSDVVSWLLRTAFTPLRHFAFNIPLLIERVGSAKSKTALWGRLAAVFFRELWRLFYIPALALAITAGVIVLVTQSASLLKGLSDSLWPIFPELATWQGGMTALLFLGMATAALALLLSLPQQLSDWRRLRAIKPGLFSLFWEHGHKAYAQAAATSFHFRRIIDAVVSGWKDAREENRRWILEIRARRLFSFLSLLILIVLGVSLWRLASPVPCLGGFCASLVVHNVLQHFGTAGARNLGVTAGLVMFGAFLKQVFVNYLGDVALYTTADENSAFFKTRVAILNEATQKLRTLLQDRQYSTVAVAGHSLGSVIGYDAINRLRAEAEVNNALGAAAPTLPAWVSKGLSTLLPLHGGPPAAERVEKGAQVAAPNTSATPVSITPREFAKLRTLITFGSPLNKVLYFFRSKLKPYETVRAHILNELHGLRRLQPLLTSDPGIKDPWPSLSDQLYWLNVYSPMDPVSARLAYYQDINECRRWFPIFGKCHVDYWHDPKFYREVLKALTYKKKRLC